MIYLFRKFFLENTSLKQTVFKNTFWLMSAEIIARFLGLFLIVYIARVLGVEEYGKFTFALSFASVAALLSDLGIIDIATREFARDKENEKKFNDIFSLGIALAFIALGAAFISSFFITGDAGARKMIWIMTSFVIGNNLLGIFFAFIRARLKMEYEAVIRILQALATLILVLCIIFYFPSAVNISYGYLLSGLTVLLALVAYFGIKIKPIALKLRRENFKLLKLSWPMSFGLMPGWLYISINSVMLGAFGLIAENGWYGAASRVVIGAMIAANLMGKSFYPVLANFFFNAKEKMHNAWNYFLGCMFALAVPMVIGITALAPRLIDFLYGEGFNFAIPALLLLVWVAAISFMSYPYTIMMVISNNQKNNFAMIASGAIANIFLNLIFIPSYGLQGSVVSAVIAALFVFFGTVFLLRKKNLIIPPNLKLLKTMIVSLASGFLMYLTITRQTILQFNVVIVSLSGICSYLFAFWLLYKITHRYDNFFRFIKTKLIEYKRIKSTKTDDYVKNYWVLNWLAYSIIYPIVRIFIGKKNAVALCEKLAKAPPPQTREGVRLEDKTDWDIFIEVFLRDVYRKDILKSNMVVVDIGAHIGIYSALAAKKAGKVIAIEPFIGNYQRLRENTYRLENVITRNIALSRKKGEMPFYVSEFSSSHSLNAEITKKMGGYSEIKTLVSTLDELLKEMNISRVDLIKIDAEGEELNILKGAEKTLKRNSKVVIIAASYHYPEEKKEIADFLEERGFKIKSDEIDIIITEQ